MLIRNREELEKWLPGKVVRQLSFGWTDGYGAWLLVVDDLVNGRRYVGRLYESSAKTNDIKVEEIAPC